MRCSVDSLALIVLTILAGCQPPSLPVLAIVPTPTPPVVAETVPEIVPESEKPSIVLPPGPILSEAGHDLILEFETGGRSGYDPRPEWPGGSSGVTVGVGYDCGYYSKNVILSDWQPLQLTDRVRLSETSGITGQRARAKRQEVKDIFVQWGIAVGVFDNVDVAREFSSAKRAIPNFEDMRANAQAAWISLGFNRGWGMSGANRTEMRAARDLVPRRDYEGMATQFRKMKRVWAGTSIQNGMFRRREAEAKLLLTP